MKDFGRWINDLEGKIPEGIPKEEDSIFRIVGADIGVNTGDETKLINLEEAAESYEVAECSGECGRVGKVNYTKSSGTMLYYCEYFPRCCP